MSIPSYSELLNTDREREGLKVPITTVLNREITVTGFDYRPSRMNRGHYLCLKFEIDGVRHVLFTDSLVLKKQCERFSDQMPFTATIIQKGQYFTFS